MMIIIDDLLPPDVVGDLYAGHWNFKFFNAFRRPISAITCVMLCLSPEVRAQAAPSNFFPIRIETGRHLETHRILLYALSLTFFPCVWHVSFNVSALV